MMKKTIIVIFVVLLMFLSIGYSKNNDTNSNQRKKEVILSIEEFKAQAKELVNKEIIITGLVVYLDRENGRTLYLGHKDLKKEVKVTVDKKLPRFFYLLGGDNVRIKGIVKKTQDNEKYYIDCLTIKETQRGFLDELKKKNSKNKK